MNEELRRAERYAEMGRVDAPTLCMLSGVLLDISSCGCKVRFPMCLEVDTDNEYELKIHSARKDYSSAFSLLATVAWTKNLEHSCEIGFNIIRSPSTPYFNEYIKSLKEEKAALDEEENLLSEFEDA